MGRRGQFILRRENDGFQGNRNNKRPYFGSEEDAFDYIKMFLEKDEDYKNNVVHPSDNIMNLYNQMDVIDQIIIKQSMIRRYRAKCMREYFKEM